MADYTFDVYEWSPYDFIPTALGSFTFSADTTLKSEVTIHDSETGIDGLTLDDNVRGSAETATADVWVNGVQYLNVDVNADAGWTLYDPVDDVYFEVVLFHGRIGGTSFAYTLSERPLIDGRTYEVVQFDKHPDAQVPGDPVFTYADYVCFGVGARLLTPAGYRAVETLKRGDLVETLDDGPQPICWIGTQTVPVTPDALPVRIGRGAFGALRSFLVSPNHRMLVGGAETELLFGEDEVFARACDMVGCSGLRAEVVAEITYAHILLDRHQIVNCEGAWSESLYPGDEAAKMLGPRAHKEMQLAMPRLFDGVASYGQTARRCLKRYEATLLRNPADTRIPARSGTGHRKAA